MTNNKHEIDFSESPACYWNLSAKITYLQRFILIHSILYYKLCTSIIDDVKFDAVAKQLFRVMRKCESNKRKYSREALQRSMYYETFQDFNGSTGFDLVQKLPHKEYVYLEQMARRVYKQYEHEQMQNKK